MNLTFYALDANSQRLGQLDAFTKIKIVPAYNIVRGWYMEMDADNDQVELMHEARSISAVLGTQTIYTGTIRRLGYRSQNNTAIFHGLDALWLSKRRALSVPFGPPYTSDEYDVRAGPAETIIKEYVDVNAGPSAKEDRRIPGLTIETDLGRGGQHTGRARFDKLPEFICAIALAKDLGVRVLDGQFCVWQPQDRSASVRFSDDTDTLGDYEFEVGYPDANYIYGAGSGGGTSQAIYEKGDSASISTYGRSEEFINIGRTAVSADISAEIDGELEKRASVAWFEFSVVETPDRKFWTNFWLGDLVSIQARGLSFSTRLSEVNITAYPDGTTELKPLYINNASFTLSRREHDRLRLMEQRLSRLEEK